MRIGIITGSGTYSLLDTERPVPVATPFGDAFIAQGTFAGAEVLHITRHGEGHHRLSSSVTHQANIWALREHGAQAILAVTVCGALDPDLELGTLIVFDDLQFSEPLRRALLEGAREAGFDARDGGCYGHVDGPRFNTRTEIRMLMQAGVTAVSQTAGPETVLAGEAKLPYALLGYATDYANGVKPDEPTPIEELIRLVGASTETFARTLAAAVPRITAAPEPVGTHFSWD